MRIKAIISSIIMMFSYFVFAQSNYGSKLIYNSKQVGKSGSDTLKIKNIHAALLSNSLIVKLDNNKKIVFKKDEVWGYQDQKGIYYRYNEGQFYKVQQLDALIIYSQRTGFKSLDKDYYFSKTLDSKIINLSRKNLKKEFSDNNCFLEKLDKELKWYHGYLSFDNADVGYIIENIYKQCKSSKPN